MLLRLGLLWTNVALRGHGAGDMRHWTFSLLRASVDVQLGALVLGIIFYDMMASTGRRNVALQTASLLLGAVADTLLLLLLVVLAKGLTIVRYKISANGRVKIAVYTASYALAQAAMVVWAQHGPDGAGAVYKYASAAGVATVSTRVFAAAWMAHAGWTTLQQFTAKRGFYRKFLPVCLLWTLALPAAVGLATALDDWDRASVVNFVELACTFVGQLLMTVMYNPRCRFCYVDSRSFPFHRNVEAIVARSAAARRRGPSGGGWFVANDRFTEDEGGGEDEGKEGEGGQHRVAACGSAAGVAAQRMESAYAAQEDAEMVLARVTGAPTREDGAAAGLSRAGLQHRRATRRRVWRGAARLQDAVRTMARQQEEARVALIELDRRSMHGADFASEELPTEAAGVSDSGGSRSGGGGALSRVEPKTSLARILDREGHTKHSTQGNT